MKIELRHDPREISDEQLIADLRRVAERAPETTIGQRHYKEHGKFGVTTIIRRFGSWNEAIRNAGLHVTFERKILDRDLFENIGRVWEKLGHQPSYGEMTRPNSRYHIATYERRFGSWRNALEQFVGFAENGEIKLYVQPEKFDKSTKRTSRKLDLAMRYRVLRRDGFRCVGCGASASSPGVELQVDHIRPYSLGGESIEANLQTLCLACNQGKSNSE